MEKLGKVKRYTSRDMVILASIFREGFYWSIELDLCQGSNEQEG
jgi:hypothetical protein